MSNPRRSGFSIASRAATLAISLAASLAACAPLAQARPVTAAPATLRWGFATVSADAAPMRAGFSELAQAPASGPIRAGFATASAGAPTSWGFASLPATQPSQGSAPVAARAGSDAGTR